MRPRLKENRPSIEKPYLKKPYSFSEYLSLILAFTQQMIKSSKTNNLPPFLTSHNNNGDNTTKKMRFLIYHNGPQDGIRVKSKPDKRRKIDLLLIQFMNELPNGRLAR